MRLTVAALAVAVTVMALTSTLSIYQLVNESGKVVLVSSFVPLAAGSSGRGRPRAAPIGPSAPGLQRGSRSSDAPQRHRPASSGGFLRSDRGMVAGSALPAATPNARAERFSPPFPHFVAFAFRPRPALPNLRHVPSRCKARASLYLVRDGRNPQHRIAKERQE